MWLATDAAITGACNLGPCANGTLGAGTTGSTGSPQGSGSYYPNINLIPQNQDNQIINSGVNNTSAVPDSQNVFVHGSPDSVWEVSPGDPNGPLLETSADALSSQIRTSWGSQLPPASVNLYSCNTGSFGSTLAQNVANNLGIPVWAPSAYGWFSSDGYYGTYPARGNNLSNGPNLSMPGTFNMYIPNSANLNSFISFGVH